MQKVTAPQAILQLVEKFDRNLSACGHAQADRDAYRSGKYNEAQLRREWCLPALLRIIDPFFEALGWDAT